MTLLPGFDTNIYALGKYLAILDLLSYLLWNKRGSKISSKSSTSKSMAPLE